MQDIVVHLEGVNSLMKSIDIKKSGGPDGLTACLLKSIAENVPSFTPCIMEIFKSSLESGQIPLVWKTAVICPVFKGGNRLLPNNYRLVTEFVTKYKEVVWLVPVY